MNTPLLDELNETFRGQAYLTLEDVATFLNCPPEVVYNWTKRADPKRRPPRLIVGKSVRFPKRDLADWLTREQGAGGSV